MKNKSSTQGFTLMELLIVVAILGILMGFSIPKIGSMIDKAKEHTCRNNLKQLHAAVQNYFNDKDGALPYAQSYEVYSPQAEQYYERRGWVSWEPSSGDIDEIWSTADKRRDANENGMKADWGMGETAKFAIENGSLYEYMNNSMEHYACPFIKKTIEAKYSGQTVYRTYAMSDFFRSPKTPGWYPRYLNRIAASESYRGYTPEGAKLLLFSEIEPQPGSHTHAGADAATRAKNDEKAAEGYSDCCLAPTEEKGRWSSSDDHIYAVHDSPIKDKTTAMAVFFDGHIEPVFASVDCEGSKRNSAWFYNRGLDPSSHKFDGDEGED